MIYLDYQATTPVDPRVVSAMAPYWTELFGNPASTSHALGEQAAEAVERAREEMATSLGVTRRELIFTSGATESNNLAIFGVARQWEKRRHEPGQLVTVSTEHKAVLDPVRALSRDGWRTVVLPVGPHDGDSPGELDPQRLVDALTEDTALVSVMLVNNEMGLIHPINELAELCHQRGVLLHCDATQGIGKLDVSLDELGKPGKINPPGRLDWQIKTNEGNASNPPIRESIFPSVLGADLISFSAHKMYGPKGVGALIVRNRSPRIRLAPQIHGGGHEQGRRSGTLNVPGIVGFAAALRISLAEREAESARLEELRNQLWSGLSERLPDIRLNGPALGSDRLPGNLHCSFPGVDGEALMMNMPQVAVSSGSACTSANPEPSHVLRALGIEDDLSRASLRFSVGRMTTADEVSTAVAEVAKAVERLKRLGK